MLTSARRRLRDLASAGPAADSLDERLNAKHVALAIACAAAVFVALRTVEAVISLHTDLPYYDHWAVVEDYGHIRDGEYSADDLLDQHNEHRPAAPWLFLLADLWLFGGKGWFPSALNIVLQLAVASSFAAAAFALNRGRPGGAALFVVSGALALALQFTSAQIETFILPFQLVWTLGHAATTAAIGLLVLAQQRRGAHALLFVGAAIACAFVAQFSLSRGGWVWPVLIALAFLARTPPLRIALIALAGAASSALFFAGYDFVPDARNPVESLARPDRLLDYVLIVLGGPAAPVAERWGARVVGATGLAGAGLLLAKVVRDREPWPPAAMFLTAHLAVSLLSILTLAFTRSPLGPESAEAPRYVLLAASAWTALLLLYLWGLPGVSIPSARLLAAGAAGVMLALAVVNPWRAISPWEDVFGDLAQAEDAIRTGVYDPAAIVRVYPEPAEIDAAIPVLQRYDLSIFRGDALAPLLGEPLRDHFGVAEGVCLGFFDATLDAQSPAGAAVSGWAWDPVNLRRPQVVLIVGPDGIIRGLATAATDRIDVIVSVPSIPTLRTGWFGYSRDTGGPATAYAVLEPELACPLDGQQTVTGSR